jgi:methionyl-tRNA synthetase
MDEPQTVKTEEKKEEVIYATIDDFSKLEIRIGTVLSAEIVEGADKLYKLSVDLGEGEPRQILSGIREYVTTEDLIGKQFPFVANLAPRTIRGHVSNGMILAGNDTESFALLNPTKKLTNGTRLR